MSPRDSENPRPEQSENQSYWSATHRVPHRDPLDRDIDTHACIVGAGIAGLTTAYLLAREGLDVVVIDRGEIGHGETGRTTAHLANAHDQRYSWLASAFGEANTRLIAESHTAAIDRIEQIVSAEKINCDFLRLDGFLFLPSEKDGTVKDLREELEAAQRAGLDVSWQQRAPLQTLNTGPCVRFPRQAQFHPLKYLSALVQAIERYNGKIFTATEMSEVRNGPPAQVLTKSHKTITAKNVILATNTPTHKRFHVHTKQGAYRTYAIAARIPRGAVPAMLLWDTGSPYHYIRTAEDDAGEILIVGGEDHKTGQPDENRDPHAELERWTRQLFPIETVEHRWSGQVMESIDGLAFIGRLDGDEPNIFVVTGDSGMGMTHGTLAAMILSDEILGRANPWSELYDARRKTVAAAGEFAKENVNVAGQFADYVTPGDVDSVEEIPAGAGAVVRRGASKIAAFRDESGALTELSAVCPHLGCIVDWNAKEKTWDCPCHGSRFAAQGKVLNGPANVDLPPAEPSERRARRAGA